MHNVPYLVKDSHWLDKNQSSQKDYIIVYCRKGVVGYPFSIGTEDLIIVFNNYVPFNDHTMHKIDMHTLK